MINFLIFSISWVTGARNNELINFSGFQVTGATNNWFCIFVEISQCYMSMRRGMRFCLQVRNAFVWLHRFKFVCGRVGAKFVAKKVVLTLRL